MHKARSLLNGLSLCASYHQPVCVFAVGANLMDALQPSSFLIRLNTRVHPQIRAIQGMGGSLGSGRRVKIN